MKGKIIRTTTTDGLILHGMYCSPAEHAISDTCIIHIHGSYGNFYENFFLSEMSEVYTKKGFTFISAGTRGRDYYADFKIRKGENYDSIRIGGIREIFQHCEQDIQAWIDYAISQGSSRILLQGHSLGAMKVVFYLKHHPESIAGLILISPPDNFGLQQTQYGNRFQNDLLEAKQLVLSNEYALMPDGAYYDPITAKSFLSLLAYPEDTGMFTYLDIPLMKLSGMASILCPLLVTFATANEAVIAPLNKCIAALQSSINDDVLFHYEIIQDANHSYHFKEIELVSKISNWLDKNFLVHCIK